MLGKMNQFFKELNVHLFFVNDIRDINSVDVLQKIKINTQFSFSYIILLTSATIVCTLGLLLNSAPVVIGGMLISPLMWPLMKISVGVSFERKSFILQAIHLLIFSIVICLLSSVFITTISPLKTITNEIIVRTTPTLLDIFVAIAAGGIAAFSIVQKKISDSLAGVAIATSLMPPLCVSGIGIALSDSKIASGGFLLFFTNVISIIFISVFIFAFVGIKRNSNHAFRRKGFFLICLTLVITSLPLMYLLQNYSFKSKAYLESKNIIGNELTKISPELTIENISIDTGSISEGAMNVSADIISPDTVNLDYAQKAAIVSLLEDKLGKKINLTMRIQKTISVRSESDIRLGNDKIKIYESIATNLKKYNGSLILDTIESSTQAEKWHILVVARTNPDISFTETERLLLQDELQKSLSKPVSLSINLLPLLSLKDESVQLSEKIKKDISTYISSTAKSVTINSISVKETTLVNEDKQYECVVHLEVPTNTDIVELSTLKAFLTEKYKSTFKIEIITTDVERRIL